MNCQDLAGNLPNRTDLRVPSNLRLNFFIDTHGTYYFDRFIKQYSKKVLTKHFQGRSKIELIGGEGQILT